MKTDFKRRQHVRFEVYPPISCQSESATSWMSGCSSDKLVRSSGISLCQNEYLSMRSNIQPPTTFVTARRTAGVWSNNLCAR